MTPHETWLLLIAISAPIAAVVGFAVQLREVRKLRLENRKLLLEIAALEQTASDLDRRIVLPTTEQVAHLTGRPMFSRAPLESVEFDDVYAHEKRGFDSGKFKEILFTFAILTGVIFFLAYFVYDIYRFFKMLIA